MSITKESSACRRVHVLQQQIECSRESFNNQIIKFNLTNAESEKSIELTLRPLEAEDYHKGFLQLLGQLAVVGNVSYQQFKQRFEEQRNIVPQTYFTVVIEDTKKKKIIATATLIVEIKYTHGCSKVGHIEDVVVDESYRGYKLGKR